MQFTSLNVMKPELLASLFLSFPFLRKLLSFLFLFPAIILWREIEPNRNNTRIEKITSVGNTNIPRNHCEYFISMATHPNVTVIIIKLKTPNDLMARRNPEWKEGKADWRFKFISTVCELGKTQHKKFLFQFFFPQSRQKGVFLEDELTQ